MNSVLPLRVAVVVVASALAVVLSCSGSSKVPGVDLGAPDIAWHDKNAEQKKGFMAAAVEPQFEALFVKHDKAYAKGFDCVTCHGSNGEAVAWKMPNPQIYALAKENTIEASTEYDEDVTKFMVDKVTPALKRLLNQGHGAKTETSCFSCHPTE